MKAVILAAGASSRFKPISDNQHKALTKVLGKPIIEHTIEELRKSGIDEIIIVQGPKKEIEKSTDKADKYVIQEEPKGMGNALKQAKHLLNDEKFLVVTPYRSKASKFFKPMIETAEKEKAETVFVSTETEKPEKYGILELNENKATDIIEKPDPSQAPSNKRVIGMYLLSSSFFNYLEEIETWENQYEEALSNQMKDTPASVLEIDETANSIKYPWDIFSITEELFDKREKKISDAAEIAESAEIKGKVIMEEGAEVLENAVIKGPAYIGKNVLVGNNALVRENSCLEENVTVGANSEIKNSVLQPESSIHSGFIGDSVIGENTNLGAGTVTANTLFKDRNNDVKSIESKLIAKNYKKDSERNYLGCFIGDDVQIGVNVSIMPGVQIGSGAKIEPGAVIKQNVEKNQTVRLKQEIERE